MSIFYRVPNLQLWCRSFNQILQSFPSQASPSAPPPNRDKTTLMTKPLVVLLSFCLVIFVGCQKSDATKSQAQEQDDMNKALQLIENHQETEAIAILSGLYAKNKSEQIALHLASAFASRAKIQTEQIWGFTAGYDLFKPAPVSPEIETLFKQLLTAQNELPKGLSVDVNKIKIALTEMNRIYQRLILVPKINENQLVDINHAIDTLYDWNSKTVAIYRSALTVILIRRSIEDTVLAYDQLQTDSSFSCQARALSLLEWTSYSLDLVVMLTKDLRIAYPKKTQDILKIQDKIQEIFDFIDQLKTKASALKVHVC